MVIDLRNNAGGHVNMAVQISSSFLKAGQLVLQVRGTHKKFNKKFRAIPKGSLGPKDLSSSARKLSENPVQTHSHTLSQTSPHTLPLLVLINEASASASEIVAAALQDHKRAKLLGTRSYGKGSVQKVIRNLPDRSGALLTIQRYYTPLGKSIDKVGLKPDIPVPSLNLDPQDNFFISKLHKQNYFGDLKTNYPQFKAELLLPLFKAKAKAEGWQLSEEKALLILKRSYGLVSSRHPDLAIDPQLKRALELLGPRRVQN